MVSPRWNPARDYSVRPGAAAVARSSCASRRIARSRAPGQREHRRSTRRCRASPRPGSSVPISGVGGTAARRFRVKTMPNASDGPAQTHGRPIGEEQEDEHRIGVSLVHPGQERERDSGTRPPGPGSASPDAGRARSPARWPADPRPVNDVPEVAEGQRPEDGDVVRQEAPPASGLLDEPPEVPGAQRQDVEDVVLVDAEVAQVVAPARRPPRTAATAHDGHGRADRRPP